MSGTPGQWSSASIGCWYPSNELHQPLQRILLPTGTQRVLLRINPDLALNGRGLCSAGPLAKKKSLADVKTPVAVGISPSTGPRTLPLFP